MVTRDFSKKDPKKVPKKELSRSKLMTISRNLKQILRARAVEMKEPDELEKEAIKAVKEVTYTVGGRTFTANDEIPPELLEDSDHSERVKEAVRDFEHGLFGVIALKRRIRAYGSLSLVESLKSRLESYATVASPEGGDGGGGEKKKTAEYRAGMHFALSGGPGTGKTLAANRIGSTLHRMGLLEKGHTRVVTREDIIGKFIGSTAPKVKALLDASKGATVFLDEAYFLQRAGNKTDFGHEVIEVLLQHLENHRADLLVILAGPTHKMSAFLGANFGLASRIPNHIHLPDLSLEDLRKLLQFAVLDKQYLIEPKAEALIMTHLNHARGTRTFGNARSVLNLVEALIIAHSHRLFELPGMITTRDILTLTETDAKRAIAWEVGEAPTITGAKKS